MIFFLNFKTAGYKFSIYGFTVYFICLVRKRIIDVEQIWNVSGWFSIFQALLRLFKASFESRTSSCTADLAHPRIMAWHGWLPHVGDWEFHQHMTDWRHASTRLNQSGSFILSGSWLVLLPSSILSSTAPRTQPPLFKRLRWSLISCRPDEFTEFTKF